VDRDKVLKQGVALNDVYRTIQTFMGGYFVNYFNRFGRQWQVYVEARERTAPALKMSASSMYAITREKTFRSPHLQPSSRAWGPSSRCGSTNTVRRKSTVVPLPL